MLIIIRNKILKSFKNGFIACTKNSKHKNSQSIKITDFNKKNSKNNNSCQPEPKVRKNQENLRICETQ